MPKQGLLAQNPESDSQSVATFTFTSNLCLKINLHQRFSESSVLLFLFRNKSSKLVKPTKTSVRLSLMNTFKGQIENMYHGMKGSQMHKPGGQLHVKLRPSPPCRTSEQVPLLRQGLRWQASNSSQKIPE